MQEDIDPIHLLLVKNWRDMAARKRGESLKQKKNHSIFQNCLIFFKFHETCNDHFKTVFVMLIYLILRYDYIISLYGQFQSYGHPPVPSRPDKRGSTV